MKKRVDWTNKPIYAAVVIILVFAFVITLQDPTVVSEEQPFGAPIIEAASRGTVSPLTGEIEEIKTQAIKEGLLWRMTYYDFNGNRQTLDLFCEEWPLFAGKEGTGERLDLIKCESKILGKGINLELGDEDPVSIVVFPRFIIQEKVFLPHIQKESYHIMIDGNGDTEILADNSNKLSASLFVENQLIPSRNMGFSITKKRFLRKPEVTIKSFTEYCEFIIPGGFAGRESGFKSQEGIVCVFDRV